MNLENGFLFFQILTNKSFTEVADPMIYMEKILPLKNI